MEKLTVRPFYSTIRSECAIIEEFVRRDPYVKNGLVARWKIRPWIVVIGNYIDDHPNDI